ncbi:unnamed protein product, partial [Coregonus sp. 'balchen']
MLKAFLTAARGPTVCLGRCFSSEVSGAVSKLAGFSSPPFSTEASLYVHWPYCLKRCSYCNFNKYIPRSDNQDVMLECLQRETETLLKLSQVSRHAGLSEEAEVTLEVNPTPIGSSKLENFLHAGVNRFSIGVQSLRDDDLKVLGRDHNTQHALQTVAEARRLCPGRVSVDVMFGRPGQSVASWELELDELLSVCDDHVSLYQLTLERGIIEAICKNPAVETPLGENPAVETPLGENPAVETPLGENPAVETPLIQNPAVETPLGENPAVETPLGENPAVETPLGENPAVETPLGENPAVETPLGENPAVETPLGENPATLEPDVWVREVQQRGHGTRRRIPLTHLGLADLHQILSSSSEVQDLQQTGLLILDDSWRPTSPRGSSSRPGCLEAHITQGLQQQARVSGDPHHPGAPAAGQGVQPKAHVEHLHVRSNLEAVDKDPMNT